MSLVVFCLTIHGGARLLLNQICKDSIQLCSKWGNYQGNVRFYIQICWDAMLSIYFLRCNEVLLLRPSACPFCILCNFFCTVEKLPSTTSKSGGEERQKEWEFSSSPTSLCTLLFLAFLSVIGPSSGRQQVSLSPRSNPCELISKLTLTWQEASLHPELWI